MGFSVVVSLSVNYCHKQNTWNNPWMTYSLTPWLKKHVTGRKTSASNTNPEDFHIESVLWIDSLEWMTRRLSQGEQLYNIPRWELGTILFTVFGKNTINDNQQTISILNNKTQKSLNRLTEMNPICWTGKLTPAASRPQFSK